VASDTVARCSNCAEQKKDERHEGGLDRHDSPALREQGNGDPGVCVDWSAGGREGKK
jgi:hypothetical protein